MAVSPVGVSILLCASIGADAARLRIVAIGASNTHGWYVDNEGAYPAQLQALLRATGIDAQVTNAGVPFDTTWMMLHCIDGDVPNGTDIVVVQPGSNDLRFFGTMQQRAANVAEMACRLRARSIKVIVYDERIPLHGPELRIAQRAEKQYKRSGAGCRAAGIGWLRR